MDCVMHGMDEPTARRWQAHGAWCLVLLSLAIFAAGCEVNSFFDPSKTGYFGSTPVTMPVLNRIAAIEPSVDLWGETSAVTGEDLQSSDLSYRLHPGDIIDIKIYELYTQGQFFPLTLRVDQAGEVHVPELGTVRAAGLTVPELQSELVARLAKKVMKNPTVSVHVVSGGALTYIIFGHVNQPGRFTLEDPTLRLLSALTMAGGVPLSTRRIYVVRQVAVDPSLHAPWHPLRRAETATTDQTKTDAPVDIESLINQLQDAPSKSDKSSAPVTKPTAPPSPGAWAAVGGPPIDIEDVSPAPVTLPTVRGPARVAATTSRQRAAPGNNPFVYLPDQDRWVKTRPSASAEAAKTAATSRELVVERVIEVPYQRLAHGDTSLNLVIRPGDQVYVDGPPVGYCYVSGEVRQPNAYPLPAADPMTLSRLIAMAGGFVRWMKVGKLPFGSTSAPSAAVQSRTS
jgi:protein involved in polysaccharide export with SLBB domain